MCGIAGLLYFDGKLPQKSELATILEKLTHRGRDNSGMAFMSNVALGHRRLSIIDLQDAAAQPMFYANKSVCVSLNGEIYNYIELRELLKSKGYIFETQSDTEVLLASYVHWGKECVKHFNGMFAFALWDDKQKILFCARDNLGIKPFYFKKTHNYFAFASEAFALSHLSENQLNNNAITSYLLSMYVATNESMFCDIHKLQPGYTLSIDGKGHVQFERYWDIDGIATKSATLTNLEELEHIIQTAIKQQIRSDVPIGGFLSGGIDSGLITALAAPQVKTYNTYSVGYEGMQENELPTAGLLAQKYETKHNQLIITANDAMSNLNQALRSMSEPIADPAMVATYMLSNLAARDGVKVLLNGTGGDEIFAGYTRYTGQLSFRRKLILSMPQMVKHALSVAPFKDKTKLRLKYPSLDMLFSTGGSFALASHFSPVKINKYLNDLNQEFIFHKNIDLLYKNMLFDLNIYLPDQLLLLLDQMTMAHTIEGRVPLLDKNIVNSAFSFKAEEHIRDGKTKVILKKIAEKHLGKAYIKRKKQGFAGSSKWWVQNNKDEFLTVVSGLRNLNYFQKLNIDKYKIHVINDALANEIFILYCFSKWHERLRNSCVPLEKLSDVKIVTT